MNNLIVLNNVELKTEDIEYCYVEDTLMQYYEDGQYENGLRLSLEIIDKFPDKVTSNYRWLTLFYEAIGDKETLFRKLEEGFRKGGWWSEKALREDYLPLVNSLSIKGLFSKIIEISSENIKEKNNENKPHLLIKTPQNYDNKLKYPLLLVLHGRYSSNTNTHTRWSTILEKLEIVIAFLQSSQKQTKEHFVWDDEEVAFKDLKAAYSHLMVKYSIDPTKIIIAGTSQGAGLAFKAVFSNIVAANGLVGVIPAGISPSIKNYIREKSTAYSAIRCSIILGEKDPRYPNTLKTMGFLNNNGVNTELHTFDGGHMIFYIDEILNVSLYSTNFKNHSFLIRRHF